jgi:hypothetical protein
MHSSASISSLSARPRVSVVIGSNAPAESLEACLAALAPQLDDGVDVQVREAQASPASLRERFGWATFVETPDAIVPLLWRDGIDAAEGEIVALTIAQMIPAADWVARIRDLHGTYDAIGGAVDPGPGLRIGDWAEFFSRYSRDMLPFPARESLDLPGDNAAYKRAALERVAGVYRHGFWEPFVHRRLAQDGVVHWQDPGLVVRMTHSAGVAAFAKQRRSHGRQYGRDRGAGFSKSRRVVGILAAPAVPFLMTARLYRGILARRRYRLRAVAVLPLILWFNLTWAFAEARGYLDLLRS